MAGWLAGWLGVCVCGVAEYPVTTLERRGQEHHGKSPANEDTAIGGDTGTDHPSVPACVK